MPLSPLPGDVSLVQCISLGNVCREERIRLKINQLQMTAPLATDDHEDANEQALSGLCHALGTSLDLSVARTVTSFLHFSCQSFAVAAAMRLQPSMKTLLLTWPPPLWREVYAQKMRVKYERFPQMECFKNKLHTISSRLQNCICISFVCIISPRSWRVAADPDWAPLISRFHGQHVYALGSKSPSSPSVRAMET